MAEEKKNMPTVDDQYQRLIEYFWRNSYQIVGREKGHEQKTFPDVFGCGFVLEHKDQFIFITADHVIHKADSEAGERTGKEYNYEIICNKNTTQNGVIETICQPIGGFISFDKYDFGKYLRGEEELEVALIPDIQDYAFAEFNQIWFEEMFTHELLFDGVTLVKEGILKIYIPDNSFAKPDREHKYFVIGTIPNKFDGIKWQRANALHQGLTFIGEEQGLYKFANPLPIVEKEWSGLSGSAFYDDRKCLVGMLVRAVDGDNFVWVIPINTIVTMIDQMIQIKQL